MRVLCTDSIELPLAPRIECLLLPGISGEEVPVIRIDVGRSLFVHQSPAPHRGFLMDRRGDGVPIILEQSRKLSGLTPIYRLLDDAELLLTIFAANPPDFD